MRSWVIALMGLLLGGAGHAACPPRLQIAFADGSKTCLTDHALADQRAQGGLGTLQRQVPLNGLFELALPRRPAMCPAAIGMWNAQTSAVYLMPTAINWDASDARQSCQRAVGDAPAGSACECVVVATAGVSRLERADFERMAAESGVPSTAALDASWRAGSPWAAAAAAPAAAPRPPASDTPGSADCPTRFLFTFADGGRGCLTDYPVAERRPAGQVASLRRMVPTNGRFHVAVPRRVEACPAVLGMAAFGAAMTPSQQISSDAGAALALKQCAGASEDAAPQAGCECVILLADGRSPLTRAQFLVAAGTTPADGSLPVKTVATIASAAQVVTPAPATAGSKPTAGASVRLPPAMAPTSPPAASTAPVAAAPAPLALAGPAAAELAALRQQMDALQAQLARQNAAPPVTRLQSAPALPRLRARALVIGNGAYGTLGALPNPRRDAEAIAAKLKGYGIEVDLVLDADRNALVRALNEYQSHATGYDVNILFYAGHGLQIGGINYIVPVDMASAGASVGSVKLTAVALNDALEYLPARTRVVFLDACRDNPLSRSLLATRSAGGLGLAPVSTSSGTLVAYATKDGSTAEDGNGRNSPYTTALLQHLDAEEDIAVVLRRVRQAVLKATSNRQEPWEYGSLVGDQLIVSKMARP